MKGARQRMFGRMRNPRLAENARPVREANVSEMEMEMGDKREEWKA